MVEDLVGVVGSVALLTALAVATIGLLGLFRHGDLFVQLHAAGLITGPAAILALLASLASGSAEIITSALLVVAAILVSSSLSTHAVALAGWRRRVASGRAAAAARPDDGSPPPMRIVLAYDGSASAEIALELVAGLAWPDGSSVRVLGVAEGDLDALTGHDDDGDAHPPPRTASPTLAAIAARLARPGLTATGATRAGEPAEAILDEAEAIDADLVVVGSRNLARARSPLVDSVASTVLDGAEMPVLIARRPSVAGVLVATDGGPASAAAIDTVARWPLFVGRRIHVLSVADEAPQYRELPGMRVARQAMGRSRQQQAVDAAVARLRAAGRPAIPTVRVGDGAARIVAFGEQQQVDLVVLGTRGRSALTRTVLGSVARDVAAGTSASVLIVRTARSA